MAGRESPKIIQFNEKLHQKLLSENELLKDQLDEIIKVARSNQKIQDHFDVLEQKILKSRSLKEMARTIMREIKNRFEVDHVTVCLALDSKDILYRTLGNTKNSKGPAFLRIIAPEILADLLPKRIRGPILGMEVRAEASPFFSEIQMEQIRSQAIIPLFLGRKLMGTLNLGSKDSSRYTKEKGTDFLRRLGCKISLAMDNIITHQRLLELSVTDQLTGIYNRRHFDESLRRETERSLRYGTALACVVADLDGFKAINDRYGHLVGDKALQHVAAVLRDNSRRQDVVARYGGDEFAVLLPHTSLESAVKTAEKYTNQISEFLFAPQGEAITLQMSIGISAIPETRVDLPEDLVKEADRRLFLAKDKESNRVVFS